MLLDMAPGVTAGAGRDQATALLNSGAAEAKFMAICEAQGGFREPPRATHRAPVLAEQSGKISAIDNRLIARIAKLAGAPRQQAAGMLLRAAIGTRVSVGDPLFEIHAETPGELAYARDYASSQTRTFSISEDT
jgi:thymidine phosphorylase